MSMRWLFGKRTNFTDYITYISKVKYQTTSPYSFKCGIHGCIGGNSYVEIDPSGLIQIRSGYCWDGPSGPTVDTPDAMRGSLRHDALYQLVRLGVIDDSNRQHADEIYAAACLEDGMPGIRETIHFKALRLFGASSTNHTAERHGLRAPR
jgi:hypothetical protein